MSLRSGEDLARGLDLARPSGHTAAVADPLTIASLHVYPIKGAAGCAPERWTTDERGLRHDRRFMVVAADGTLITQREVPALARVRATIRGASMEIEAGDRVTVAAAPDEGEPMTVRVWDDEVPVIAPSADADLLLSEALGRRCRLLFQPESTERWTAEKRGLPLRRFSVADAAPVLVLALGAMDELNERLAANGAAPVGADRFRPNITVRGGRRGEDDAWTSMGVGALRLRLATRCKRCQVVTIDQASGAPTGAEPLRTLASYRREGDGIVFGRHALVDVPGTVAVGDAVDASPRDP